MKCAPILISVYDRLEHFKRCIQSLKNNQHIENTVIYLASDGPKCQKSSYKVKEIRNYIKSIDGFKKINVFTAKENTNKDIILQAREKMASDFDRYICTEDDIFFSPFYLDFINSCLEFYEDDNKISAVCGHNLPNFINNKNNTLIALKFFSAYGYGTWRDKDLTLNLSKNFDGTTFAMNTLKNKKLFKEINIRLPHLIPLLREMLLNKNFLPRDVINSVLLIKKNKVCIFPSISFVRNDGYDNSGENCGINSVMQNQKISQEKFTSYNLNYLDNSTKHTTWIRNFFTVDTLIFKNFIFGFFYNNFFFSYKWNLFFYKLTKLIYQKIKSFF